MARLATGRDSYLSREEIVDRALELLDTTADVSTRKLAGVLGVTPTAIYYHFSEKREIVLAVVDRIWQRAVEDLRAEVGDPVAYDGDPTEFLVSAARVVRRAFGPHPEAALYIAMTVETSEPLEYVFLVFASTFERLGVAADRTEAAFYAYTTFVLGSVLIAASRRSADDYLARKGRGAPPAGSAPDDAEQAHDDELFEAGVRSLLGGLTAPRR